MARSQRTDVELLAASAAGNADAFATFYRRHLDLVVAYLRARVSEPEIAFDLAAETFAAAAGAAGRFEASGPPAAAWLIGIAHNKLLESWRRGRVEDRARRALRLTAIALDDEDLVAVEDRAAAGAAPLARLLDALSPEVREAVLARVVDERDYADIAGELECSEQVVRQRVSRGLARLRAGLREQS
jgi:RNA polymerase sigma-70 factor (ECF subfamily)